MTRSLGLLAAALGALAFALSYLALQGAGPDAAQHERTIEALRTLALSDAALQRDILRARAGLLGSYDPIVSSVRDLEAAAAALQRIGAAASGDTRAEIARQVEALTAAVRGQERLVETFKSRNAILRNSLAYFIHLSNELGARAGPIGGPSAAALGELANAMLRLAGAQRRDAAGEVAAALDRLAQAPIRAEPGRADTLVVHGRLIVDLLPEVDDLVAKALAAPIAERTRALQETYLAFYGRAAARAGHFRMLLYGAALLLLAYLAYLFLRLRHNARSLQSRLGFESLIAAISTSFIDLPRERIGGAIEAALARLGEHTGVDRALLVIGDEGQVERAHVWSRAAAGPGLRPADLLVLAAGWSLPARDVGRWLHVPHVAALPEGAEKSWLRQRGVATWLCIPIRREGRRIGFLAFDSLRRRHWLDHDIALSRTAAEIFGNAIERERSGAEREALQDRLAQAQRLEAVGTLAGGIAHEFNNILGVILGAAEMALAPAAAADRVRRHIRQIMTAAERAQQVVDQVLAFSRRRERQHRHILVQPVVAEALELIRATLPATLTLRIRLEAEGAAIRGDPTEVQQVVMNLCTNAAQAMDGRGQIELDLAIVAEPRGRTLSHGTLAAGPHVRLTVCDRGHGMDAATMQRIFEPFFTTKPVGRGTGLGLPTVHGIVTQQGGALNVESRPGSGSRFEVYWPQTEPPAASESSAVAAVVPTGRGQTVILVDDEPALVLLGEEMLAALGYEPVGFESGAAALAAFRADPQRFDLALLDEVMPETTGCELAKALHEARPDLPIVLMTGHRSGLAAHRLGEVGVCEVLGKPLRSASLAACLDRHLGKAARAGDG